MSTTMQSDLGLAAWIRLRRFAAKRGVTLERARQRCADMWVLMELCGE